MDKSDQDKAVELIQRLANNLRGMAMRFDREMLNSEIIKQADDFVERLSE